MPPPRLTVRRMIEIAPDLFCASEQFLLIESTLADLIKRGAE